MGGVIRLATLARAAAALAALVLLAPAGWG
jgi:hypothetical protein